METFLLVKGDTASQIKATITKDGTTTAIDLSTATTRLKFRKKRGTSVLSTITSTATAQDKANGIALFVFGAGTLDVDEGAYEGEIEITYSDSSIESVYEVIEFHVRDDF